MNRKIVQQNRDETGGRRLAAGGIELRPAKLEAHPLPETGGAPGIGERRNGAGAARGKVKRVAAVQPHGGRGVGREFEFELYIDVAEFGAGDQRRSDVRGRVREQQTVAGHGRESGVAPRIVGEPGGRLPASGFSAKRVEAVQRTGSPRSR